MDAVGLRILHEGLKEDAAVIATAAARARQRLAEGHPGSPEACGFELHRLYNVLEKMFERVCEAFENHFEKRGDYHEKRLERLSLELPEIRPALFPAAARGAVRELKSFRHVFRHAYDLTLRVDRLEALTKIAAELAASVPQWIGGFVAQVERELN